jgi:hypothetical protein
MGHTKGCGPARRLRLVAWLLVALTPAACSLPRSPTMASVPPEWRDGNPFSPEANAARAAGLLHVYGENPHAEEWKAFARAHVQTGDVLFHRGRACTVKGKVTSMVLCGVNDGRFSHDGLACWEGEQLWVYDMEREGARKVPFELWMLDTSGDAFAVKRLRPEYRDRIPQALAFCEDVYQRQVPFDFALSTDDEHLYCSEMVEKAFRSGGLHLSEPIPIHRLPGFRRYCFAAPVMRLVLGINVRNPVFALGNEHYGTFASPLLETVYEGPEPEKPERGQPDPGKAESE